jgi:hypothetical protein
MPDDVLRLRATVVSDEALANIRKIGREIGLVQSQGGAGMKAAGAAAKAAQPSFGELSKSIGSMGKELLSAVPALGGFGIGIAGAGVAARVLVGTLGDIAGKIVDMKHASAELGMTTQELQAFSTEARKAGIAPEAMMAGLAGFKRTVSDIKLNIGDVRGSLAEKGAGAFVNSLKETATQGEALKKAFEFKGILDKQDPSGELGRRFFDEIKLGAQAARLSYEQYLRTMREKRGFTPDDLRRAQEFQDALVTLGDTFDKLKDRVGLALMPHIQRDLDDINKFLGLLDKLDQWWEGWQGKTNKPKQDPLAWLADALGAGEINKWLRERGLAMDPGEAPATAPTEAAPPTAGRREETMSPTSRNAQRATEQAELEAAGRAGPPVAPLSRDYDPIRQQSQARRDRAREDAARAAREREQIDQLDTERQPPAAERPRVQRMSFDDTDGSWRGGGIQRASFGGEGGSANESAASRVIKIGVFDALVEFKSYVQSGGAGAGGGAGIIQASLPGGAAGGWRPSGGGGGAPSGGAGAGGAPAATGEGQNAPGDGGNAGSRPGPGGQGVVPRSAPAGATVPAGAPPGAPPGATVPAGAAPAGAPPGAPAGAPPGAPAGAAPAGAPAGAAPASAPAGARAPRAPRATPKGEAGRIAVAKAAMKDQLRKEGVPEANLEEASNLLAGQALSESDLVPTREHDKGTGYGIYGARDDPKGRSKRRSAMLNWMKEQGYAKDSLEGQAKYMAHEATSAGYSRSRAALMGATPANRAAGVSTLISDFERPGNQGPAEQARRQRRTADAAAVSADAKAPQAEVASNDPPQGARGTKTAGDAPAAAVAGKTTLITHHTGGRGTPESVMATLRGRGLGAQYIMDREGNVVPTGLKSAHIKPGQGVGRGLSNKNTEGIEIIAKNDADINEKQVEAVKRFYKERGYQQVFGHGEINTHKQRTEGVTAANAIREAERRGERPAMAETPTKNIDAAVAPPTATGSVNVTVNSNGTKAETGVKSEGKLFSDTQVKQHRQMQRTEDAEQTSI